MIASLLRGLYNRLPVAPVVCAAIGLAAGYLAVGHTTWALTLLGAGAAVALFAVSPISVALLAAPTSFYTGRLSIGHGISLPDIVLLFATLLSFPALARLGTPSGVSNVRRWLLVYVVGMSVSIAVHPSSRALIEAAHRTMLVGGAVGVGAWIYLEDKTRIALRLLVGTAVVVALACIFTGAIHGFTQPAAPFRLNKNYVGSLLGLTILVTMAAPNELGISQSRRISALSLMGGGLAATHSRAAMLALVAGLFVWFFRMHSDYRRRSFHIASVLAVGFLALGGYLIKSQVANTLATKTTNSVAVRNQVEAQTRDLWRSSPIVGVGIYYYNDAKFQQINHFVQAPNNSIDEALAEGGIVLAAGFIAFHVGAFGVLWRRRNPLAVAGLAMVVDRFAHGMVDIYWTAGNASLPWIIAGMGLAQASALTRSNEESDAPIEAQLARTTPR